MDLPTFSMAGLEDSRARIIIHWDFENVCIPRGWKALRLYNVVVERLREFGYQGEIEFRAFWGIKGPKLSKHTKALEAKGVTFHQATEAESDAADHLMIYHIDQNVEAFVKDLMAQYVELDEVADKHVHVLIAGDHIFFPVVQMLMGLGSTVLLVYPRLACDSDLREMFSASSKMSWLTFLGLEDRR